MRMIPRSAKIRSVRLALGFVAGVSSLCFLGLPGLTTSVSAAEQATSVYTELLKGKCKFITVSRDGNEQIKRCPGVAGAQTYTHSSHTRVYFGVRWPGEKDFTPYVTGWSLGDKVEWRGVRQRGVFRPHAMIVRVIDVNEASGKAGGHVLAVLRAGKGATCLAALVDVRENARPNELAREAADRRAAEFPCGEQKPEVVGAATTATRNILERLPD